MKKGPSALVVSGLSGILRLRLWWREMSSFNATRGVVFEEALPWIM